jgi:hypothetical protein
MARRDGWDSRHSRPHATDYMSVPSTDLLSDNREPLTGAYAGPGFVVADQLPGEREVPRRVDESNWRGQHTQFAVSLGEARRVAEGWVRGKHR